MKKSIAVVIVAAMVLMTACSGGGKTETKPEGDTVKQETVKKEEEKETETETESQKSGPGEKVDWNKLGDTGEVDYNAAPDIAWSFAERDRIYQATRFDKTKGDGYIFCYLCNRTWLDDGAGTDLKLPEKLEDVPADIRDNYSIFWDVVLSERNGLGIESGSELDFNILSQETVTINGKDFVRETFEITATYTAGLGSVKTGRCIAYYFQDVANPDGFFKGKGEGVFMVGDCSEAQDRFDDVCAVADAIMATYRPLQ